MNRFILLVALALACNLACSTDDGSEEETDTRQSNRQEEVAVPEDVPESEPDLGGTTPGACADLPLLTGKAFRVTSLVATKPTDKINDVWATDISTYDLVIIFYVVDHDQENNQLKVQVTSATAQKEDNGDGTFTPLGYQYSLAPSTFDAVMDGCKLKWDAGIELDIITPTINKPFHVFGIDGHCLLNEAGTKILDGWLEGAILEETCYDLCLTIPGLGVANFHWFMNLAHICPNYDSDEDGKIDSYEFSGHIAGVEETELFQEGVVPQVSVVDECPLDEEVCKP